MQFFVVFDVNAWSGKGHKSLAESVFQNLSPAEQAYFQKAAASLGGEFSDQGFQKLSPWVDTVKEYPLEEIFSFHEANFPPALNSLRAKMTKRWHYHNVFFSDDINVRDCKLRNVGDLRLRLLDVERALANSREPRQEAILLAFFMHMLEDLHQPLHTISKVDKDCQHDRGGNQYCVQYTANGRCKLNLHQLWDRGFGVWDSNYHYTVGRQYYDEPLVFAHKLDEWLLEGSKYQTRVYPRNSEKPLEPMQLIHNQKLVKSIADKSVQRMVRYLKQHYKIRARNG